MDAHTRRAQLQARARAIGVNEAYISVLVDTFYARVRGHPLIGPIFEDAIGEDWGPHLIRMKAFWASVTLNSGAYSGKPIPAHQKLTAARPWHFKIWLALFRQTLEDTAPHEEVVDYFQSRAERIAENLQLAMFGAPGETGPPG